MENSQLVEKWQDLISADKAPHVSHAETMAQLLENEESYLTETGTVQADMQQYTPILVPAVRRIFPNLLANEIVGVQSMNMPTGYAYALRYAYAGGNTNLATGQGNRDRGQFNRSDLTETTGVTYGAIGVLLSNISQVATAGANTFTVAGTSGVALTVRHTEAGRFLVSGAASALQLFTPGATGSCTGIANFTVVASFGNEAGFNLIFKNYIAPVDTATGEAMKFSDGTIKQMKLNLERIQIEAKTRKLGAEYTIELAQDLKNVHGLDAEAELINILEYEIGAELDRELVDLINAKSTNAGTWTYGKTGQSSTATAGDNSYADGRWEAEKVRTLYTRILRESQQVALSTRRGAANFLLCSSNVVAALESLSGFMYAAVPGTVKPTLGVAKVGTLDGRFTVYLDTFATSDYVTLGYKGSSAFDTGVIYCPYVPLMLQKVTDPDTLQPKIAFMTRDAIAGNLWGTEKYYRKLTVDFTGSQFGSNSYYGSGSGLYTSTGTPF